MRVCFVVATMDRSGGSRMLAELADGLQKRGHEVAVVTPLQRKLTWTDVLRSVTRKRRWPASPNRPQRSHFDTISADCIRLNHAPPVTDDDLSPADVVVATWWETACWVEHLSPSCGAKVYLIQDYETWSGRLDELHDTYRSPLTKIVTTQWLRDILETQFQQTVTATVPCGVNLHTYSVPPREMPAHPTVGLIYSSNRRKGTDIVLKAVELARERMPELRLVCMSNGGVSAALPLPPGAEMIVKADDAQARGLYAQSTAWLFGSRTEGFGLPILEAMACRTPVIGTPAGAAKELIGEGCGGGGAGGILVPHESPHEMADAIMRICSLPSGEWRRMSDVARATAVQHTWELSVERFESALNQLIRQEVPV